MSASYRKEPAILTTDTFRLASGRILHFLLPPAVALLFLLLAPLFAEADAGVALPFQIRSQAEGNHLSAEITGTIQQPFAEVAEALLNPDSWCEFIPLSFNVKACTTSAKQELNIFVGRKIHQTPEEAYHLAYRFTVRRQTDSAFTVLLTAERGPLGTKDYRMELTGEKTDGGTLLRFRSSHRESLRSKLATAGYLRTVGRDKVGFSVAGNSHPDESLLVSGVKGVLERNAMRYYLALQAFFATSQLPPEERFEARIRHWFELTSRFPRQLWEMDLNEYLAIKRLERQHQQRLQDDRWSGQNYDSASG